MSPVDPATLLAAPVRTLRDDDFAACLDLAEDIGWLREEHKWRLLFSVGTVYGVDDPTGGLAGAVVLTRYGDRVGSVSMMMVAQRHGRRGLGTKLMRHLIDDAGVATLCLTATDEGRPLYEKVGFRSIDRCAQYGGDFTPGPADDPLPAVRPFTPADLPAVLAKDAEVFGAPRTALVERLPVFCERLLVVDGPHGIAGYGGRWRNVTDTVVGPVIADDESTARALITDLAGGAGRKVRLDLEDRLARQLDWATAHGLRRGWATAVMVRGDDLPGDRARLFNPVMVALG